MTKHYVEAHAFVDYVKGLISDSSERTFKDHAASDSIYITVYLDETQSEERIYRFSDHANCRKYTASINVAPNADTLNDAKVNVFNFLQKIKKDI